MGFRVQAKLYKLVFPDDEDLNGFEITVRSMSVGEFQKILRLGQVEDRKESVEGNEQLIRMFASKIDSWNLEDDKGKPVKPGFDAVSELDNSMVSKLLAAWTTAALEVPKPPRSESPNGLTPGDLGLGESSSPLS